MDTERIMVALERIADALERLAPPSSGEIAERIIAERAAS